MRKASQLNLGYASETILNIDSLYVRDYYFQ
jgi:hypothetical protein